VLQDAHFQFIEVRFREFFQIALELCQLGDLFEIILIQIKGGGAKRVKRPDKAEAKRLRDVKQYYEARTVVLAEWIKGRPLKFYWLTNYRADPKRAWGLVDPGVAFR
jgi:hypothetical protein